ncbi:hypothetical protein FQA47_006836 [Oryzias melastigma]|uniref:Uncharacterized protein n=1 Tax=Oryzias melastigma TaxID=30732 RepID=A0A834F346_ORYME|nr:hypothetical protein FQA47_006836 [Oryzias melastigma]
MKGGWKVGGRHFVLGSISQTSAQTLEVIKKLEESWRNAGLVWVPRCSQSLGQPASYTAFVSLWTAKRHYLQNQLPLFPHKRRENAKQTNVWLTASRVGQLSL